MSFLALIVRRRLAEISSGLGIVEFFASSRTEKDFFCTSELVENDVLRKIGTVEVANARVRRERNLGSLAAARQEHRMLCWLERSNSNCSRA